MKVTEITAEQMKDLFRTMSRIRYFEIQAIEIAKSNITRTAVHTYHGEEAIGVGVCAHLRDSDYITSTHRGHGHCISKGADVRKMFAEIIGRKTGYGEGKGGSMHIADVQKGILGANGIVGGSIPISVGAGLSVKLNKTDNVVVCFFGDGASNEGSFHESLNLASIWHLPIIFVCENNKYGISSPISTTANVSLLSERAHGYGIKGYTLNGNDIAEVYTNMADIVADVRNGNGPVLVEMDTYRMTGHYYGDNECYRDRKEKEFWRAKDPIDQCRRYLEGVYKVSEEEIEEIEREEREYIQAQLDIAISDPDPVPEDVVTDVYDDSYAKIQWIHWTRPQPVR